jgi:Arc/MetJ family transcription regulator
VDESREDALTDLATKPATDPEVDQNLLAEAQRHLSAASRNAAINEALRRLVDEERAKRRKALEASQRMADEGLLDFSRLEAADQ